MSRQRFRVELLGLIEGVEFAFTLGGDHRLLWTPEGWTRSARAADGRWLTTSAPGLAPASTQAEARRTGEAFLTDLFASIDSEESAPA